MGGGGERAPYPKWVWSYYGGWWPHPKNWRMNTAITGLGIFAVTAVLFNWSAKHEKRHVYPNRWIPSMLWAHEFHDPKSKAMWIEQLNKEGREWIEPIPDWWPFKKKSE